MEQLQTDVCFLCLTKQSASGPSILRTIDRIAAVWLKTNSTQCRDTQPQWALSHSTATVTSNPRCITTTATSTSTTIFICTKILFISYCKKTLIIKLEYWLLWITIGDRAARQHTCKWNCRESTVLETCPLLFLYINSFLPVILQFALERKILLCQLLLQCFNICIKIRGKFIKKNRLWFCPSLQWSSSVRKRWISTR